MSMEGREGQEDSPCTTNDRSRGFLATGKVPATWQSIVLWVGKGRKKIDIFFKKIGYYDQFGIQR